MLGRRRRRRANIEPTLVQCLVFAGTADDYSKRLFSKMSSECRVDVLYDLYSNYSKSQMQHKFVFKH